MKIPEGYTEEEVLAIFNDVIKKLAKKFTFGYRDIDDITQEALIIAINGLEKYDPGPNNRPLANFLYIHIKNRLCNFKRRYYIRLEKPCTICPLKSFLPPEGCSAYNDRMDCKLYARWYDRNIVKRNLTNTLEYNQVDYTNEDNMKYNIDTLNEIDKKEIFKIVDKEIPVNLRKSYIMILNNIKINKKDYDEVIVAITQILKDKGYPV